jgi:hypothetical protein
MAMIATTWTWILTIRAATAIAITLEPATPYDKQSGRLPGRSLLSSKARLGGTEREAR